MVNSLNDPGTGVCDDTECTLREAIALAGAGATITFAVSGTITLTAGQLQLTRDLTIRGPGRTALSVSGNNASRVFHVAGAAVAISGLTITGGRADRGGGILNLGSLSLTDCAVRGNLATGVMGDTSGMGGGGIYNGPLAQLTVTGCTIVDNRARYDMDYVATRHGGGIDNEGGEVKLIASTISENGAGHGGGLLSNTRGSGKTALIVNSTISGNWAFSGGSGVHNAGGRTVIDHSTVSGNTSQSGAGVSSAADAATRTELKGSIVWGNLNSNFPMPGYAASDVQVAYSLGYNLVGAGRLNGAGDRVGVTSALLAPLQVNAPGATATHALQAGSPAIDAGSCADAAGGVLASDQRGVARPQGRACDMGAYESEAMGLLPPIFSFDLAGLPAKTYGDPSFSVAPYAHTNSSGAITFAAVPGTTGCRVTPAGDVTIVGATVAPSVCSIDALLAPDATYTGAGTRQSFSIARAPLRIVVEDVTIRYGETPTFHTHYYGLVGTDTAVAVANPYYFQGVPPTTYPQSAVTPTAVGSYTVSASWLAIPGVIYNYLVTGTDGVLTINPGVNKAPGFVTIANIPTAAAVGGSFTPTYVVAGDGIPSTRSTTAAVCAIGSGVVSFSAAGTCTLVPSVTEGTGYLAATGNPQSFAVTAAPPGPVAPIFTFDLSGLASRTYGDPAFSVASYASSTSAGAITFGPGAGSVGCSVTVTGQVTITGAAPDPNHCIIVASQGPDATHLAAGSLTQGINIGKAAGSVMIDNLPGSGWVGGSIVPTYARAGDGLPSVASATPGVCTVSAGVVRLVAAGTCTLRAAVAEGTNYLAATGPAQSFTVAAATTGFSASCRYQVDPKTAQRSVFVSWENAEPGVTLVRVLDGRTVLQKGMTPTATGSWSTGVKNAGPTYELRGGPVRGASAVVLVPWTPCAVANLRS